jgi:hypothetical protein
MNTQKILSKLQSRIDKRSNLIAKWEDPNNQVRVKASTLRKHISLLRQEQTLDKRLFGEIMELKREADYWVGKAVEAQSLFWKLKKETSCTK